MEKYLDIVEQELLKRERWPVTSHWASKLSRMAKCPRCGGEGKYLNPSALAMGEADVEICEDCVGGRVLQGECMRALFWHWIGVKPSDETEAGAALKMAIGRSVHEMMEDALGKVVAAVPEHRLEYKPDSLHYPIVARGDSFVLVPGESQVDIVEIKSVADSQMRYLQKDHEVRDDWFTQGCVEAALWMREFPHLPVRNLHFLIIGRGNANRYEAVRPATPETVEEVLAECVERCAELEGWLLQAANDTGDSESALPPPEYKNLGGKGEWSHWKCDRYCQWRTLCKERG